MDAAPRKLSRTKDPTEGSSQSSRATKPGKPSREVQRFADRLAGDLSALIALVPPQHLSSSGLSRWLGVNRGTCQRVLLAVRAAEAGGEPLAKAPGVEGLDEFVKALAIRIGRHAAVDRAEALVQDYALLVQRLGGSQ